MVKLLIVSVTDDMPHNRASTNITHMTLNTKHNVLVLNSLENIGTSKVDVPNSYTFLFTSSSSTI